MIGTDKNDKLNKFIRKNSVNNLDNKIDIFVHQEDYRIDHSDAYLQLKVYMDPTILDLDKLQNDLKKCKEILNTDKCIDIGRKFDADDVKVYVMTIYS